MRRGLYLGLAALLAIGLTALPVWGAEVGSEEDPLVAKSYVDQFTRLQVLELEAGRLIRGEAGTELILRSGQARAVTAAGGGISDLTAGRDIGDAETVVANHLLLIPRSDGRGLLAVTDIVVLVRGPLMAD